MAVKSFLIIIISFLLVTVFVSSLQSKTVYAGHTCPTMNNYCDGSQNCNDTCDPYGHSCSEECGHCGVPACSSDNGICVLDPQTCGSCSCQTAGCNGLRDCTGTYSISGGACTGHESCNTTPNSDSCGTPAQGGSCDMTNHNSVSCGSGSQCTGVLGDGCGYCQTPLCNNNGVQDNNETGVDCGGGDCGACPTPTPSSSNPPPGGSTTTPTLPPQPGGAGVDPIGSFDGADCGNFGGWACDADNYSTALSIHFYADGPAGTGTWVDSTVANTAREQAVANLCGGYANHGFFFTNIPNWLKDGQTHSIYAYAINVGGGNNKAFTAKSIGSCYLTLSGRVTSSIGNGISGVVINSGYENNPGPPACRIGTQTTDANGNYSFANIPYNKGFCMRGPSSGVAGYGSVNRSYECQITGGYFPNQCGDLDATADNTYNFVYTPVAAAAPTITKPSCITAGYSLSGVTISWTNPTIAVTWADIITPSGGYYHKAVSGSSTTAPSGFTCFSGTCTNGTSLTLSPTTNYSTRLWNGSLSPSTNFSIDGPQAEFDCTTLGCHTNDVTGKSDGACGTKTCTATNQPAGSCSTTTCHAAQTYYTGACNADGTDATATCASTAGATAPCTSVGTNYYCSSTLTCVRNGGWTTDWNDCAADCAPGGLQYKYCTNPSPDNGLGCPENLGAGVSYSGSGADKTAWRSCNTTTVCSLPWIQVTGDVHSNGRINAPGGP